MKQDWKPGTLIYPLPAVLVSCGSDESEYNILTVAWTGTICTNPPMCYISVRPERHSYPIIKKNMEFVINLTTRDMAFATDWCGVRSGKLAICFTETWLRSESSCCVSSLFFRASRIFCPKAVKSSIGIIVHLNNIVSFRFI